MKIKLTITITFLTFAFFSQALDLRINPTDFLPKGYVVFDKIYGDVNKDGLQDCVLIIKGINKNNIKRNEIGELVDLNRRGLIVLLKRQDQYELALKNYQCFSSENEDGGVYFPPELSVEIKKGNLIIHYSHGRYGYWQYIFRFQNSDFKLIGYDLSEGGAVVEQETSINFLTKKKQIKVNVNQNAQGGDEVFRETWSNIQLDSLINFSEIADFDELDVLRF